MPLIQTRALVLHTLRYGETSRILKIFTPEFGLRSVIAKGADRPRNRFGGMLELFTEGDASFNLREGRELFTLSGFSLIRGRQGIGRNLGAFAGASVLAEITLRTGTEEAQPELYDAMVSALNRLAEPETGTAATALAALWYIISIQGFQPEMTSCVQCGRLLEKGEMTRFDVEAGGSACRTCRPAGRLVDPVTRCEVADMATDFRTRPLLADRALHGRLLEAFLAAHLAGDRPLRALPLFLDGLRTE